jgi:hypothetical protein
VMTTIVAPWRFNSPITRTVTAAIWFGITTGYLTLIGSYHMPRRLAGWR